LLALVVLAGSLECQAQSSVKLSWQLEDSRITLHEPVLLKLKVENTGSVPTTLDLGWKSREGLLVTVIKPDGTIVKAPAFDPAGDESGAITRIPIGPGAIDTEVFVVDQFYVFDQPGQYEIGASLRFPFRFGDGPLAPGEIFHAGPFSIPDNPRTRVMPVTFQTITIEARDEAALRRRAESLVERAVKLQTTPGTHAMDREALLHAGRDHEVAMRALDVISDPAVIPYLMRLITPSFVGGASALSSLAKFLNGPLSDPAGLQAFIQVAKGPQQGRLASEARGELLFKARRTSDPALQKQIYDSVGEPQPR
jgi:hypothetical protein